MKYLLKPQTTLWGPCGPRNILTRAQEINIGISEAIFHPILHNPSPNLFIASIEILHMRHGLVASHRLMPRNHWGPGGPHSIFQVAA